MKKSKPFTVVKIKITKLGIIMKIKLLFASVLMCTIYSGCSQLKTADVDDSMVYKDDDTFLLVKIHAQKAGSIGIWKGDLTKVAELMLEEDTQLRLVKVNPIAGARIASYSIQNFAANFDSVMVGIEPGAINYIGDIYINNTDGGEKGAMQKFAESVSQQHYKGGNLDMTVNLPNRNIVTYLYIKDEEKEAVKEAYKKYPKILDKFPVVNKIPSKTQTSVNMKWVGA